MLSRFRRLGHYWTRVGADGWPLPLEWALMFVFLILAAAVWGWTKGVCMVCPANTVLAAFQGIRQWMKWLIERFKKPACHRFWSLLGSGLDRDGSRPDGITVFPFSGGRSLVWDCSCVDIFAGVHLNRSAMEAGTAASRAEEHKRRKYAALAEAHQFEPIEVETMGVYGGSTGIILRAIGRRLVEATGEPREVNWFRQNLASGIQRGNAFSILSANRESVVEGRGSRGPPNPSRCSWENFVFHERFYFPCF